MAKNKSLLLCRAWQNSRNSLVCGATVSCVHWDLLPAWNSLSLLWILQHIALESTGCKCQPFCQGLEGYSQDLGQNTVQDSGNVNRIWLWMLPREQVLSKIFWQGCVTGKENDIWEGDGKTLGCRIHVKKEQNCGISPSPPPLRLSLQPWVSECVRSTAHPTGDWA